MSTYGFISHSETAFWDAVARTYYGNLAQSHGKASDCVKCGRCEQRCPQHLSIREHLKDVAEELEG